MRFPVESTSPFDNWTVISSMPLCTLPEIRLPAPVGPADGVAQGALEFDAVVAVTECRGAGGVGADAVPLHQVLGRDVVPVVPNQMPSPVLPEMTFPCTATVPPIVLFALAMTTTPSLLATAAEPVASVPTRFPCTRSPVEAWIRIPSPALEEMTFPAGRRPADGVAGGRRGRRLSPRYPVRSYRSSRGR